MLGCIFNLVFWLLALCLMAQVIKCVLMVIICLLSREQRRRFFCCVKNFISCQIQRLCPRSPSEVVVQQNTGITDQYPTDPAMYQQYYQQGIYQQYPGYQQQPKYKPKKRWTGGCGCGN